MDTIGSLGYFVPLVLAYGFFVKLQILIKMERGEIRKKAEELLGKLSAAYLGNLAWDNRSEILLRLDNINNSDIDWNKDVSKSVRELFNTLTSSETISVHIKRVGENFSKEN